MSVYQFKCRCQVQYCTLYSISVGCVSVLVVWFSCGVRVSVRVSVRVIVLLLLPVPVPGRM